VDEADAGEVLAPLSSVARMTTAQIVAALGIWLEADTVLALVVLARRRLRVHHRDHVVALTVLARVIVRAATLVVVDAVHTGSAVLAHVVLAVVDVVRTVGAMESSLAIAAVVGEVIHALGSVRAGIEFGTAELDLGVAKLATESRLALTFVRLHSVDAGGVVLTLDLAQTIVDIRLAAGARVSRGTLTAESTLLQHRAGGVVAARIAVAGIDHELAVLAMIAWLAEALVLPLRKGHALGLILAGLLKACIALGQDVIAHAAATDEARRGRREDQLVLHRFRFGAASNSRLHVVQLDPVGEPLQSAVTVQRIAAQSSVEKKRFNGLSNSDPTVPIYSHVGQRLEVLKGALRQH